MIHDECRPEELSVLAKLEPNEIGNTTFAEPWHAELFAITVQLSRQGAFSWNRWVERLSQEIAARPQRTDENADEAYYRQWLGALEAILSENALLARNEIEDTQEHWRRSYLNTPHGSPVELRRDLPPIADEASLDHNHHHSHPHHHSEGLSLAPVAVSPAVIQDASAEVAS